MSDQVVFNLFSRDGVINPTPWGRGGSADPVISVPFCEMSTDGPILHKKQTQEFDGGWRYWEHYDAHFMTIYNVKLDRRAFADLTRQEIVNSVLQPETLLNSVKGLVLVEHTHYQGMNWLEDYISALGRRTMIEIKREIRGDNVAKPQLHSVR